MILLISSEGGGSANLDASQPSFVSGTICTVQSIADSIWHTIAKAVRGMVRLTRCGRVRDGDS